MNNSVSLPAQVGLAPNLGVGFARRAAAQVIDLIVYEVLALVLSAIAGIVVGLYGIVSEIPQQVLSAKLLTSSPYGSIVFIIGYLFYHAICEGIYGATLGKLISKIHVIGEDGSPATMGSAFIRSLAFYIDVLFFGVVAALSMRLSKLQQRLGDKWAKTVVVERSSSNPYRWPSGWKFVIAFLLASMTQGFILTLYLMLKVL